MAPWLKSLEDSVKAEDAEANMQSQMDMPDADINSRLAMRREVSGLFAKRRATRASERLTAMAKLRPLAARLQALSPVPRSMARADQHLTDFCISLNHALDGFKSHIYRPDMDTFRQAEKDYIEAGGFLEAAERELEKAGGTNFKGKTYVPG